MSLRLALVVALLAPVAAARGLARPGAPAHAGPTDFGVATGPLSLLPTETAEVVEVLVTAEASRLGIPGLSAAIANEAGLVFANGYGFSDIENFVVAKADTSYRLASLSKPITAVAVLQLAERGQLDLDAPIQRYCPAFPEKRWPVTVRQLLCHQGGIRHYREGEGPITRRFASLEEGLTLFKDDPLAFEPGTQYLYSTYGYNLLGCAVEGASGRPFLEVLRETVFNPAEMTRTQADDVLALVPNRARGYIRNGNGALLNSGLDDMSYKVPGGGLSGTAPDLARFGHALLSGRLLAPASLREMLRSQETRDGRPTTVGLGLDVTLRAGEREVWKTGGQTRVSNALYLRPDSVLAVVVLTNLEGVQPMVLELARQLADAATRPPDE